jgi:hypothetical protein
MRVERRKDGRKKGQAGKKNKKENGTRIVMNLFEPADSPEFVTQETLPGRLERIERGAKENAAQVDRVEIGASQGGRRMWGIKIGRGDRQVGVVAGAHADEPVGPMTSLAFAEWLATTTSGRDLLDRHTFYFCPQINPDGAEANRAWFGDPLDPIAYFKNVHREPPGEDVEFGYPEPAFLMQSGEGGTTPLPPQSGRAETTPLPPLRPENEAVARFLASAGGPFVFHASLHGMGFSEGAWFLIGADWAERSEPLRRRLSARASELEFGIHDIDRRGEKGFTRIAPGYSTTPTRQGMREYFLARDDSKTADLFHLGSMDFVRALGGDPLVMVSELPLFMLGVEHRWTDPPGDRTPYLEFRRRLEEARPASARGEEGPIRRLLAEFQVRPTPLADQVRLQGRMIVEALEFLAEQEV